MSVEKSAKYLGMTITAYGVDPNGSVARLERATKTVSIMRRYGIQKWRTNSSATLERC